MNIRLSKSISCSIHQSCILVMSGLNVRASSCLCAIHPDGPYPLQVRLLCASVCPCSSGSCLVLDVYLSRSGLVASCGGSVRPWLYHFPTSPAVRKQLVFSHVFWLSLMSFLKINCRHPGRLKGWLLVVLTCTPLMTNDVKHLSTHVLSICVCFFWSCFCLRAFGRLTVVNRLHS